THHGLLPAAERLALHDCAGDTAVDISVADFDIVDPVAQLGIVQRMNAAGQAVARGVLPFDGIFQGLGVHDAQDWAEALVEVVPGTRLYVIANTRGPQGAFLIELFWLINHFSPGSNWVRPRSSLSLGGSTRPFIVVSTSKP